MDGGLTASQPHHGSSLRPQQRKNIIFLTLPSRELRLANLQTLKASWSRIPCTGSVQNRGIQRRRVNSGSGARAGSGAPGAGFPWGWWEHLETRADRWTHVNTVGAAGHGTVKWVGSRDTRFTSMKRGTKTRRPRSHSSCRLSEDLNPGPPASQVPGLHDCPVLSREGRPWGSPRTHQ